MSKRNTSLSQRNEDNATILVTEHYSDAHSDTSEKKACAPRPGEESENDSAEDTSPSNEDIAPGCNRKTTAYELFQGSRQEQSDSEENFRPRLSSYPSFLNYPRPRSTQSDNEARETETPCFCSCVIL